MGLSHVRERFFARFPEARHLDGVLRSGINPKPIFYMDIVSNPPDIKDSGLALVRLGDDIERRFGINGEVATYFMPWRDFQRRAFNAITLGTAEIAKSIQEKSMGAERFTPSRRVALLISGDPLVEAKLDEWQNDSYSELIVVSINPAELRESSHLNAILSPLGKRLGERDLYETQNPVSGKDFFGRTGLLRQLAAAINGDLNVAILGLRRSGKTSILRELQSMLLPRRVIMPIADFQMLESGSAEEFISSIAASLNEELKTAKSKGIDVWIGNESDQAVDNLSPAGLSDRIKRVAARNADIRIVIAVDEVESASAIAESNPTSIKVLLGALRAAAQARENVSLIFSGVANRMFKNSTLGPETDVDNPMFNQVSSVFLTSFSLEDTSSLLKDLGRPMLLDWQDDAVEEVQRLTGGFPYFVRDLASKVRTTVRTRQSLESAEVLTITSSDVRSGAQAWSDRAAEAWLGIVKALGIHYPAAAFLLDSSLSVKDLNEWVASDPDARDAAQDLIDLGLLGRINSKLEHSDTLVALRTLGKTRQGSSGSSSLQATDQLAGLIQSGESHNSEFKETGRINIHTGKKDTRMEDEVVKTVAGFLNSDGGDLLIGVADDGTVKGIDRDLKLFNESTDRYERWIRGDLLAKRIDQQLITDNVTTKFAQFRGKLLFHISVTASQTPAWVDDKIIYRRSGNQTMSIESGRDLQTFLTQRNNPPI